MNHPDLDQLVPVNGEVADNDEIIVIGSQAVPGRFPNAPVRHHRIQKDAMLELFAETDLEKSVRERVLTSIKSISHCLKITMRKSTNCPSDQDLLRQSVSYRLDESHCKRPVR